MMATEERKTYNGWTNYETWNAALWMDNEEYTYREWRDRARRIFDEAEAERSFSKAERAALTLMDQLKADHEDAAPDLGASFYSDILQAALSEVNWYEIAQHLIEEVTEDA